MSCLFLTVNTVEQLSLSVTPGPAASVAVAAVSDHAALTVGQAGVAQVTVGAMKLAALSLAASPSARLVVGEVCMVCAEELVVLAGRDGPFRNRAGGFFLLDPARCPPD